MGKLEGKSVLGRPRCKLVVNIKGISGEDWVIWSGFIWLRSGTSGGHL
jgi:hypothetical protein